MWEEVHGKLQSYRGLSVAQGLDKLAAGDEELLLEPGPS